MQTEPVLCSQCGAPLEVPAGVQFVTCKQCGVGLRVKHDATVAYTEVIDKLAQTTDQISDHLAALRHEQELERIDREWQRERESLLVTSKRGQTYAPTKGAAMVAMLVGGGFGIFWTVMACGMAAAATGMGAPSAFVAVFPMFGIVFTVLAVVLGISTLDKANKYQRAEAAYHQRRAAAEQHERG